MFGYPSVYYNKILALSVKKYDGTQENYALASKMLLTLLQREKIV